MVVHLFSTRFNDITLEQNMNYRTKNNIKCIYGIPYEISTKIFVDDDIFVIEMNNSKNRIEGIGLIKNRTCNDKYYKIYQDGNYNRFIYKGKFHLSRDELLNLNEELVRILDYILFKEKTHLKRGSGFTTVPNKLLNHNICENMNIMRTLKNIFIESFI
jgi:hypothetical protein